MIRFVCTAILSLFALMITAQEKKEYETENYRNRTTYFRENPIQEYIDVVFLGNSLTQGGKWAEYFPQLSVANRGISGDNTEGILNRLDEIILSHPKKLFILVGINDISQNRTNKEILKNYKIILQRIKDYSPNTQIFVQSLLPINNDFKRYSRLIGKEKQIILLNKRLKKLATKENVTYININSFFMDKNMMLSKEYTTDGLHLNELGYKIWSAELNPFITK